MTQKLNEYNNYKELNKKLIDNRKESMVNQNTGIFFFPTIILKFY